MAILQVNDITPLRIAATSWLKVKVEEIFPNRGATTRVEVVWRRSDVEQTAVTCEKTQQKGQYNKLIEEWNRGIEEIN